MSRFLLGFFDALTRIIAIHQHHLINVIDHGPQSCIEWFESLDSVELTDVSALSIQRKVAAVRELDLDIAIDLSGWTSGHFLVVFLPSWLLFRQLPRVFCIHWDSGD